MRERGHLGPPDGPLDYHVSPSPNPLILGFWGLGLIGDLIWDLDLGLTIVRENMYKQELQNGYYHFFFSC